jgi:surfeit locus 1 family protein
MLVPLIAGVIALAILIGLGTWQLQRLAWKEALVAHIEARVSAPPVALPDTAAWHSLDLDAWEYRPVEVTGTFRNDLETRVYALLGEAKGPLEGPGYWIVTPLEREGQGGGTVLINRGFVPLDRADPATRPGEAVDGPVTVRGLLRRPEDRNAFTPNDDPAKRLFYARDPAAIAPALNLSDAAPFTIDARESGPDGLPQGGETRVTFANRHLEYALTWYGLAAALAGVLAVFLWRRRRPA